MESKEKGSEEMRQRGPQKPAKNEGGMQQVLSGEEASFGPVQGISMCGKECL